VSSSFRLPFIDDVALHGDRLAVFALNGAQVTYRELDERVTGTQVAIHPPRVKMPYWAV
jgi:hypothetical protein